MRTMDERFLRAWHCNRQLRQTPFFASTKSLNIYGQIVARMHSVQKSERKRVSERNKAVACAVLPNCCRSVRLLEVLKAFHDESEHRTKEDSPYTAQSMANAQKSASAHSPLELYNRAAVKVACTKRTGDASPTVIIAHASCQTGTVSTYGADLSDSPSVGKTQ